MKIVIREIPIEQVMENTGQIPFVPENPRRIKDEQFELLKKSIQESPEMKNLDEALDGRHQGMAIVMKGTHLCKTMRGARANGQMTVSHVSGIFKENAEARREFYKLVDLQE